MEPQEKLHIAAVKIAGTVVPFCMLQAKDPEKPKGIVVCWEQAVCRAASLEQISTEEGMLPRVNCSIQVEGAFDELKHNRRFPRFLTCGQ